MTMEDVQRGQCLLRKGFSQMTETDDEALKIEIDEIMSTVDSIMEKVARVIPEDKPEPEGQG